MTVGLVERAGVKGTDDGCRYVICTFTRTRTRTRLRFRKRFTYTYTVHTTPSSVLKIRTIIARTCLIRLNNVFHCYGRVRGHKWPDIYLNSHRSSHPSSYRITVLNTAHCTTQTRSYKTASRLLSCVVACMGDHALCSRTIDITC